MHSEVLGESLELTLDFNGLHLQQRVFDISLQKIANVIPTAAVKQTPRSMDFLFCFRLF